MSAGKAPKANSGKPPVGEPARVEINLDLEPGTDLEVTLIARKETGQPLATRVIKFRNPQNPADKASPPSEYEEAGDLTPAERGKERTALPSCRKMAAWLDRI